jgi:hypothetical protein
MKTCFHNLRAWIALMMAAAGCGSRSDPGIQGSAETDFALCDDFRDLMTMHWPCHPEPDPQLVEGVYQQCKERVVKTALDCRLALEQVYDCSGRLLSCPDALGDDECRTANRRYAECVSGGACHDLGGGQANDGTVSQGLSIFTNYEVCQCTNETWDGGAPGQACRSWMGCVPVCCPCPGSTHEYTAAVCDFAQDPSFQSGICPSADRACALTRQRCPAP